MDALEWWRPRSDDELDAHLLCTGVKPSWEMAGRAYLGHHPAVASGMPAITGSDHQMHYLNTTVHEVGHCLGLKHEHGEAGNRDDGTFYATPMARARPDEYQLTFSEQSIEYLQDTHCSE